MNPKGYKFEVQIYIEKLEMKCNLSFKVQVILKCGNQKLMTQQLADFNQGNAIINETLCIQTNLQSINGTFQEKIIELLILLITTKGNKKAGQCYINIAQLLNQEKYDINQELLLENCPDHKAKIYSKIRLAEVEKVDLEVINPQSSIVLQQGSDKKQGLFTPLKAALENTVKKYFGDNQSAQSQNLENQFSRNYTNYPILKDDSSHLNSQIQQQNFQQVQQDLQDVHEELQQQMIMYTEMKDQNDQLKQELEIEKGKKEALNKQVQEQRLQMENMIDQHKYQEQIYQYEQQLSQIQSQLRQAQKDNETLTLNYKKAMQQQNKLSEEYNQNQQSINYEEKSAFQLKQKIKELEEICNEKDQLYQALEKSNNDSQLKNIYFENQIIQLHQQVEQLKTKLISKDVVNESQKENLNSLNIQLLNLKNQNSSLQQTQRMMNDKIDEQSKQIVNQQELINQQFREIKQQYEDILNQNQQTIQQLNKELNEKNNELNSQQTTCKQLKLQLDDVLKQLEKSKKEGGQIQPEPDLNYMEKESQFQEEIKKCHEREEELKSKVQILLQSTNQFQKEVMRKLFRDPQIPNAQAEVPNQLIELNRAIALKFSKLKQDLEGHQLQIQAQEQSYIENSENQHMTLELTQAKLKIDNLLNENKYLHLQLATKSECLNNLNLIILNQNQKIENLESQNKDFKQKSQREEEIHHQLSQQIKVVDDQKQDLQIQIKALQIEILKKEDLINNESSKILQLSQQNQQQIIINEQLQFQIKEQTQHAQQLKQEFLISKSDQDQQNNSLIMELNRKIQALQITNQQIFDQKQQKENQIEKLQQDRLFEQKNEDQSKKEDNQYIVGNLFNPLLIEETQESQQKQQILEQRLQALTVQLNQQTSALLQAQTFTEQLKNEYHQILEKVALSETELKLQLEQSRVMNNNLQSLCNSQRIQLNACEIQIQQKNNKIDELETQLKQNQFQFQKEVQELQQQLFTENDQCQKEKEIIQQYIDELEYKQLELTNQVKEKDIQLSDIRRQNEILSKQLVELQQINERTQNLEQSCLENIQKYEQQIQEIKLKNIQGSNNMMKQIQELSQQSQQDQVKLLNLQNQLSENEDKHASEIQLITKNYVNGLKYKDDQMQQIQNNQQIKLEQQNGIKFLESIKNNLEQEQFENFQYNSKIQFTNENLVAQNQPQELQLNQLQKTIKELEQKNQELEIEKINISNNYQQALIEAQSLNHIQHNSNEKIEKIQEEVIILKCRIGDMLNTAQEFGGAQLVDKLQQALGIKEQST
ncbi:unnamed protein product [Paramecium octaurelia]|uniref:C2 NT-type domain-containing protein n=1 Tax=Paramecium octaurelia TaxID=43137 RepID=A0A8S1TW10_PAROT|nr:unnamed protein product [Paramecium octaurelia]